jgi:hypothetical protein
MPDPRRAAYDLKKLRAKNIVRRIAQAHRYESTASGLRATVALVVLRNKAHANSRKLLRTRKLGGPYKCSRR